MELMERKEAMPMGTIKWGVRHRRVGAWLGSGLLALAALTGALPAAAVAAPSVSLFVNPEIPAGGVITGTVQCTYSCGASLPSFTDSNGVAVPGTFVEGQAGAGGAFVFIPTTPLTPGTYSSFVSGGISGASASFTVIEATNELPTFVSSVTTVTSAAGESVVCQQLDSQMGYSWFTEQSQVKPVVVVGLSGLYASQYRYALALPGETPEPVSGTAVQRTFDETGEELCFDIFGFSYQDDSMTEIGHECVSLTELDLGVIDEAYGSKEQTLLSCVIPPAGYEEEWCAMFEPAFTSGSCDAFTLDACFAARNNCPSGDNPSDAEEQEERDARAAPPTGGVSGVGGSGGAGQGASVSTGGTTVGTGAVPGSGGAGQGDAPSGDVRACSLVRAPSSGGLGWLLLGLPLAYGVRRRRLG